MSSPLILTKLSSFLTRRSLPSLNESFPRPVHRLSGKESGKIRVGSWRRPFDAVLDCQLRTYSQPRSQLTEEPCDHSDVPGVAQQRQPEVLVLRRTLLGLRQAVDCVMPGKAKNHLALFGIDQAVHIPSPDLMAGLVLVRREPELVLLPLCFFCRRQHVQPRRPSPWMLSWP